MAEELKISAEADLESIFVFENTGKYSAKNTGGWGSPNLKISDITSAQLIITSPGKSPVTIDVYPTFPNDQCTGFEILAEDLDLDYIPSGIWGIEYVAKYEPTNGDAEEFRSKCYFYFYTKIQCCIENRIKKISLSDPKSAYNEQTFHMNDMFTAAKFAYKNGQVTQAQNITDYINTLCDCCS